MDVLLLVGILMFGVVAFFGYQWWAATPKRVRGPVSNLVPVEAMANFTQEPNPNPNPGPNLPPTIPGQTEEEQQRREPNQQHTRPSTQQPIGGQGPAQFEETLRHPEQQFYAPPAQPGGPHLHVAEIPGSEGSPGVAAQNEGPLVGGVFAFDGMESSGMTPF